MHAAFAVAAFAGSAFARPNYGQGYNTNNHDVVENVHLVVETFVQTVYVTEPFEHPKSTHSAYSARPVYSPPAEVTSVVWVAPTSTYVEPAQPTSSSETPQPTPEAPQPAPETPQPTPEAPQPTPTPEEPQPTPTPTPSPAPEVSSSSDGYMDIVNEYRQKMGLPTLTCSTKLESNSLNCLQQNPGQMVHILNSGSFAQVLAPGQADDFLHVFVGGWLCERPSLRGLDGVCSTQSDGWTYEGQTGHADICSSTSYTQIGCSFSDGIWGCDFA